ncbi:DUF4238 domain-containing protein [Serratia surfactantfaciens]|uniref:DUF4238 domain-containing protein n=1 Tax=Serratia surfactantfaciens TaxID=2741499 RepID=UPI000A06C930|nr:DUF4238 domain-containing protein [Serratia surfactantfaciens]
MERNTHKHMQHKKNLNIKPVPYEPQCQKRYFYGSDLHLEERLGIAESKAGDEFNKLLNSCLVPLMAPNAKLLDDDEIRRVILTFIYIQYCRTQKAKNIVNEEVRRHIKEHTHKNREAIFNTIKSNDKLKNYNLSDDEINDLVDPSKFELSEPFHHIFRVAHDEYNKNNHLKIVVIFNTSKIPFITSDNPVFNFVIEFPERVSSFFLPITPAHCLFCYDERYFKVRKIENVIFTADQSEIRYINKLQCDNSNQNIYISRLPTGHSIQDVVEHNIKNYFFIENIDAISLSENYEKNICIPLTGGHVSRVDTSNM